MSNNATGAANNPANGSAHPNPAQISEPTNDIEQGRQSLDYNVNNNNNNSIGMTNPLFTENTVPSNAVPAENNFDAPTDNNNNINNINDNNPNINNANNNPPQNGPRTRNIDISLSSVSKVLAYVSHAKITNLCKYSLSIYRSHHFW